MDGCGVRLRCVVSEDAMTIDDAAIARYRRDGYLIVPELFSRAEVDALLREFDGDFIGGLVRDTSDSGGRTARFAIWSDLHQDVWGATSTCPRVVDTLRTLVGEEISFFHGKIINKQPGTGASWEWHQDYGYWYYSFAYPRMASVWVSLDPATRANGCLSVLRGSHRLGRLEHRGGFGDQMGADPKRFAEVAALHERVDCEVPPGSAIFFDACLLHGSNPNTSGMSRRSFIMCYTAQSNPEFHPGKPPYFRPPCPVGSDDGILAAAAAAHR
jgi:ectoine hydroxylase-related dioxygenase (phytanoyl-CoA dioxygenase family)